MVVERCRQLRAALRASVLCGCRPDLRRFKHRRGRHQYRWEGGTLVAAGYTARLGFGGECRSMCGFIFCWVGLGMESGSGGRWPHQGVGSGWAEMRQTKVWAQRVWKTPGMHWLLPLGEGVASQALGDVWGGDEGTMGGWVGGGEIVTERARRMLGSGRRAAARGGAAAQRTRRAPCSWH